MSKNCKIEIPERLGNNSYLCEEIIMISSNNNDVEFHLANDSFKIQSTLKGIQQYLVEDIFVRINRSVIINLKHIKFVTENTNVKVYLSNDTEHIISDNLVKDFFVKFRMIVKKPA